MTFKERGYSFVKNLIPHAEKRLKSIEIKNSNKLKVAVFGDASGSMQVAVKSASVIASLLSGLSCVFVRKFPNP